MAESQFYPATIQFHPKINFLPYAIGGGVAAGIVTCATTGIVAAGVGFFVRKHIRSKKLQPVERDLNSQEMIGPRDEAEVPEINGSDNGSVDSSYEEGDMEEGIASSSVEDGYELATCDNQAERIMELAAYEEECSDEDAILLLYQEDTREWFICGKNTNGEITNEAVRSSSPLGQLLESRNVDEVAAIEPELMLDKAESYLLGSEQDFERIESNRHGPKI